MNHKTIEQIILSSLFANEKFARAAVPFLKSEYFHDKSQRILFQEIVSYIQKYNDLPTKEALAISLEKRTDVSDKEHTLVLDELGELAKSNDENKTEWLLTETEKFCQDKAIYNAIMDSIHILDGKDKRKSKDCLPQLLSEALGVSFDPAVGHDFVDDYSERCDFYHRKEEKIPFDLKKFNEITCGGFSTKTLNVFMAGCVDENTKVIVRISNPTHKGDED